MDLTQEDDRVENLLLQAAGLIESWSCDRTDFGRSPCCAGPPGRNPEKDGFHSEDCIVTRLRAEARKAA
jgi:hypothetical protein